LICHCAYVSFEAEANPETTTICNCTDCQTMSGAPLRAVIITQPGTFLLLSGTPTEYRKTGDSGAIRAQGFCPRCGTALLWGSLWSSKCRSRQKKDCRQQHGADWINVLEWIERYTPELPSSIVAKKTSDVARSRPHKSTHQTAEASTSPLASPQGPRGRSLESHQSTPLGAASAAQGSSSERAGSGTEPALSAAGTQMTLGNMREPGVPA
jgi:hypothetical protein